MSRGKQNARQASRGRVAGPACDARAMSDGLRTARRKPGGGSAAPLVFRAVADVAEIIALVTPPADFYQIDRNGAERYQSEKQVESTVCSQSLCIAVTLRRLTYRLLVTTTLLLRRRAIHAHDAIFRN